MPKTGFRGERKRILTRPSPKERGSVATEKIMKPPPSHKLRSRGAHTQLLLATSGRGNVAGHLFGKPPNPRRGTSWKRRQTSSFTYTQLLLDTSKRGNVVTEKERNDERRMTRGYLLGSVFVEKRTM